MGIPICGACRRPIEERIVTALGKHWHVEVSYDVTVSKTKLVIFQGKIDSYNHMNIL
jgi:hypothetical protein